MNGIVRVGDSHAGHCCGSSCHGGVVIQGSPTMMIDGIPIARDGDYFSCGDQVKGNPDYGYFVDGLPVARLGDMTYGHGCFPPTMIISASGSTKIG